MGLLRACAQRVRARLDALARRRGARAGRQQRLAGARRDAGRADCSSSACWRACRSADRQGRTAPRSRAPVFASAPHWFAISLRRCAGACGPAQQAGAPRRQRRAGARACGSRREAVKSAARHAAEIHRRGAVTDSAPRDLQVPEHSIVEWCLNKPRDGEPPVELSDGQTLKVGAECARWNATESVFWRWRGARYNLQVMPDTAPRDHRSRRRRTWCTCWRRTPAAHASRSTVRDDYAVTRATMHLTLARGSGENVRFSDREVPLPGSNDPRARNWSKEWSLAELGMEPGDELYFFVRAHRQRRPRRSRRSRRPIRCACQARSRRARKVTALPMLVKPENLRSQRQIIIDTEQLVADMKANPRMAAATVAGAQRGDRGRPGHAAPPLRPVPRRGIEPVRRRRRPRRRAGGGAARRDRASTATCTTRPRTRRCSTKRPRRCCGARCRRCGTPRRRCAPSRPSRRCRRNTRRWRRSRSCSRPTASTCTRRRSRRPPIKEEIRMTGDVVGAEELPARAGGGRRSDSGRSARRCCRRWPATARCRRCGRATRRTGSARASPTTTSGLRRSARCRTWPTAACRAARCCAPGCAARSTEAPVLLQAQPADRNAIHARLAQRSEAMIAVRDRARGRRRPARWSTWSGANGSTPLLVGCCAAAGAGGRCAGRVLACHASRGSAGRRRMKVEGDGLRAAQWHDLPARPVDWTAPASDVLRLDFPRRADAGAHVHADGSPHAGAAPRGCSCWPRTTRSSPKRRERGKDADGAVAAAGGRNAGAQGAPARRAPARYRRRDRCRSPCATTRRCRCRAASARRRSTRASSTSCLPTATRCSTGRSRSARPSRAAKRRAKRLRRPDLLVVDAGYFERASGGARGALLERVAGGMPLIVLASNATDPALWSRDRAART